MPLELYIENETYPIPIHPEHPDDSAVNSTKFIFVNNIDRCH